MQNRFLAVVLVILSTAANCVFGQSIFRQKLDSICEISFPETPTAKNIQGYNVYFLNKPQSRYFVLVQHFDKQILSIKKTDSLVTFYQGVMDALISDNKGKLIRQNNFSIDGFKGVEFEYQIIGTDKPLNMRFERVILLNENLYDFSYWCPKESVVTSEAEKNRFLNSFYVVKNKDNHQIN